jgi:glucose dehydrogenase
MVPKNNLGRRAFLAQLGSLIAALSSADWESRADDSRGARALPGTGRFGDIDENVTFDVCIIGSGFAGAILGESLVRRGIKTAILESGPDPRGMGTDPRFQQLEEFRSSGPIEYPIARTRFRGLGGTSWLWGGFCTRLFPVDFERNPYTPPDASWPITYADLEPYYDEAEKTLRVRGATESEYDPPRKLAFPLAADRSLSPLQSLLKKAGIVLTDVPFSTSLDTNGKFLSGRYEPFLRMTERQLPRFQASPHGALFSEVTVTRLLVDPHGHTVGAEVKDLDRNAKILRARVYVVACGGLESPRLLLLSRSRWFPEGLGNSHGWVGRCFMEHRKTLHVSQVRIDMNSFNLFQLTGFSYQFYKGFKERGLGGIRLRFRMDGLARWREIFEGKLVSILDRVLSRRLEITFGAEMKPVPENRVTLDKHLKDYFGNAVTNLFLAESEDDLQTRAQAKIIVQNIFWKLGAQGMEELPQNSWGHHHMGTCRMGDNPRTSVVDRNLRVHDTRNLYVAGSSVFVTSGSANPTLTLSALSLRMADHIAVQLRQGAFPGSYQSRHEELQLGIGYA